MSLLVRAGIRTGMDEQRFRCALESIAKSW